MERVFKLQRRLFCQRQDVTALDPPGCRVDTKPATISKNGINEWPRDVRSRILIVSLFYLPGTKGGGPVRSIVALVDQLSGEFDFRIATADRDYREREPYPNVATGAWIPVGGSLVRYCSQRERSLVGWRRFLRSTPCELYYLSSFFSSMTVRTLVLRRLGLIPKVPVLLGPRGECAPKAMALKRWKKLAYVAVAKRVGLFRGVIFHATTKHERDDILSVLCDPRCRVSISRDVAPGMATSLNNRTAEERPSKIPGEIRLILLGRISPMKNVDFAINALSGLTDSVILDLVGPLEDMRYWNRCLKAIRLLPQNIVVRYLGMVAPSEVWCLLRKYHALFLPSRGENFCHAIVEALGAGLPVLISDRTPWKDLRGRNVGWTFSLEGVDEARQCLREAAALDAPGLGQMSQAAAAFGGSITGRASVGMPEHRRMFRDALRSGSGQIRGRDRDRPSSSTDVPVDAGKPSEATFEITREQTIG
jgi:glycosyltransferase involved in cell wall biosynthesis